MDKFCVNPATLEAALCPVVEGECLWASDDTHYTSLGAAQSRAEELKSQKSQTKADALAKTIFSLEDREDLSLV